MATVVDKVLAAVDVSGSGEHVLPGPGAGKVWVAKDIAVHYDSYAGPMEVAVYTQRGGVNWNILNPGSLHPNPDSAHWTGWRVFEFGDTLGAYQAHTSNLHVWVSGFEITV